MNPQSDGEQLMQAIIGALSTAIVEMCRSIERQWGNTTFNRQSVIVALQDAARKQPIDSDSGRTAKAILENIAVELESGNRRAGPIPFRAGKG